MPSGTVNDWSDGPVFENNVAEPGTRSATTIKTGTRDDEPLVQHVEYLKELPDFYIFYCRHRRRAETVKEERA
jgi:hypothetical protein